MYGTLTDNNTLLSKTTWIQLTSGLWGAGTRWRRLPLGHHRTWQGGCCTGWPVSGQRWPPWSWSSRKSSPGRKGLPRTRWTAAGNLQGNEWGKMFAYMLRYGQNSTQTTCFVFVIFFLQSLFMLLLLVMIILMMMMMMIDLGLILMIVILLYVPT